MKNAAISALVVFLAAAAFWSPSVNSGFLADDDPEYVTTNEHMYGGLTLANAAWAFNCGYAANWHPLAWLSLMADVSLSGASGKAGSAGKPWSLEVSPVSRLMHAHNVVLHALNSALLFLLMVAFMRNQTTAIARLTDHTVVACLILALIWAVHPLRAEVVCWVSERKELSSVFFMLLALLLYLRIIPSTTQPTRLSSLQRVMLYVSCLMCYMLALMAKPVAVTLPVVIFAYDVVICGKGFRKSVLMVLPFLVLALGACVLTLYSQDAGGAMANRDFMPYWARVSSALKAPVVYLWQTICPIGLSARYPLERTFDWRWAFPGMLIPFGCLVLCAGWWRSRGRIWAILAFGVAWVYIGLIPMLGIVKVGTQPHSDRYTYWIGCGLCVILVILVKEIVIRWPAVSNAEVRQWALRVLVLMLAAYGVMGWQRSNLWREAVSHLRDAYAKSGFFDMGCALSQRLFVSGREEEGEMVLRDAVSRAGEAREVAKGHLALYLAAKTKADRNDLDEARYLAQSALAADDKCAKALEALGLADYREGKLESACVHLEKAVAAGAKDGRAAELLGKIKGILANGDNR